LVPRARGGGSQTIQGKEQTKGVTSNLPTKAKNQRCAKKRKTRKEQTGPRVGNNGHLLEKRPCHVCTNKTG